jgi:hypothetical protein
MKKLTQKEAEKLCNQFGIKLLSQYIDSRTPCICQCVCGNKKWKVRIHRIKCGDVKYCIKCRGKRLTTSRSKAQKKLSKYNVKIVDQYIDASTPVNLQCPKCGNRKWKVPPKKVWIGHSTTCCSRKICDVPQWYISRMKYGAIHGRSRRLEFEVDRKYLVKLFYQQKGKCALTNIQLSFGTRAMDKDGRTASLDRVDSSKGYIRGNVQWVHKDINKMKQELNQDRFIEMCRLVIYNKERKNGLS